MKSPAECQHIEDIRAEIDSIDEKIIALIGQRADYVKSAAKFKADKSAVRAPDRVSKMMLQRRQWAEQNRISPDMIEKIYNELVSYFIGEEFKHWEKR
jgi:isochorismate pyruvate lyase